ncbi:Na/Pi symporter [Halorhodospira halochloris]|uniref:Na/Pi cotransporter family protein n=1 Tax=Halorhodospira halochloris TaxID=1052 RepID=UPI001EE7FC93|nr:Na/Pi symporter [Halorhodospira halochloris]MCG5529963.1 Na/Pi symporter [Halorhodospira halochloris]
MNPGALATFLGGVGLFLLGMRLMSDGLRVAAGPALRDVLAASTRSRLRGLFSGVLITSAVQSSSAVIFATIGFVNAGLLTLYQSIGVIYGANIGTTLTSWVVALVGFNVNLQALALPLIAIGVGLRLVSGSGRRQALGDALAGLGVFFLGLDVLQQSFTGVGDPQLIARLADYGLLGLGLFVVAGIVITTLTQSSSAALAVTLTAAAGGLIPIQAAAAMLIGAALGTTSTAVFAALGATANAQRAAVAHVIFNLVAGVISFAALPWLLSLATVLAEGVGLQAQPAVILAVFHTLSKLLGVAAIWPLTGRLVEWLEARFRRRGEDRGQPIYLDSNVLATPSLALEAVRSEAERCGSMARQMICAAISGGDRRLYGWLEQEQQALERLVVAINEFANSIERAQRDESVSASLPNLLRVTQYYQDMAERALVIAEIKHSGNGELGERRLAGDLDKLMAKAAGKIEASGQDADRWNREAVDAELKDLEGDYQRLKNRLLRASAEGRLGVRQMVAVLDLISAARRGVDQALKAARYSRKFQRAVRSLQDDDQAQERV